MATVYILHNGILDDPHGQEAMDIKSLILKRIPKLEGDKLTFVRERKLQKRAPVQ